MNQVDAVDEAIGKMGEAFTYWLEPEVVALLREMGAYRMRCAAPGGGVIRVRVEWVDAPARSDDVPLRVP
jgi:hypothetical protein